MVKVEGSEEEEDEVVAEHLDQGTADFATWVVGLTGDARRKKRERVVKHTISLAHDSTPKTACSRAQQRHACRIVERSVRA